MLRSIYLLAFIVILASCDTTEGEPRSLQSHKWEKMTLDFKGPASSETAEDNPFLNYRLQVRFTNGNHTIELPGFFAADGNAAETSAESGNVWRVHFRPDREGSWTYQAFMRKGAGVSISDDPEAGEAVKLINSSGSIEVGPPAPGSKGKLQVSDGHYLRYGETGEAFLKGGADSPENFLAYQDFDGTRRGKQPEDRSGEATANEDLHHYNPHADDFKQSDPTWKNGLGKNMIGALNYLADKGMNSVYFLTMNIEGDGKDVWPYTGYDERERFDCSKLDQWEIVFDHMDRLGLMLHIVTQETENEKLLDDGNTGPQRKLYYRELIARFAHHLGVCWNMGEENGPVHFSPNGQNMQQRKDMVAYIKTHDPYKNLVVIHTHPGREDRDKMFDPLLDFPYLDGISIQAGNPAQSHEDTRIWRRKSAAAGNPWVVHLDEIGDASRGVDPDDRPDNNQDSVRAEVLWGNLMGGGAGAEWYFGYKNHNNDLGCEDWRSRDRMWDYTRHALEFFHQHLPFDEMSPADELTDGDRAFCLAKTGEVYAVYFPYGGTASLDLSGQEGSYTLQWYNPRSGKDLQNGSVTTINSGGKVALGNAPDTPDQDWAVLVKAVAD